MHEHTTTPRRLLAARTIVRQCLPDVLEAIPDVETDEIALALDWYMSRNLGLPVGKIMKRFRELLMLAILRNKGMRGERI